MKAFARHFAEMLAAMLIGMATIGAPFHSIDGPAAASLGMAFAMTLPMAAWMRHRAHSWPRCAEMAAAMFTPALALIALHSGGTIGPAAVLTAQHAAMVPIMLAVMLARRGEYSRPVESRWSCPICARTQRAT